MPVFHILNTVSICIFFPSPIKNGDLIQDDIPNLKWEAVMDSLKSRVTQTPVVLLRAKEFGMKTN